MELLKEVLTYFFDIFELTKNTILLILTLLFYYILCHALIFDKLVKNLIK